MLPYLAATEKTEERILQKKTVSHLYTLYNGNMNNRLNFYFVAWKFQASFLLEFSSSSITHAARKIVMVL
jgi:hypothetical protein